MRRVLTIIICFLIAAVFSCRKEIPFNAEITTPKLVVNSLFASDSTWAVHVSRSLSVIDQGSLDNIENATVVISDASGAVVETLTYDGYGNYVGTQSPQVGQLYRVDVAAPNYVPVYGSDVVPNAVNVQSLDTMSNTVGEEDLLTVQIVFKDPPGVRNYYRFAVEMGYWEIFEDFSGGIDSTYYEEQMWILLNDPSFEGSGNNSWRDSGIMTDLLFDGQTKTVDLPVSNWFYEFQDIRIEFVDVYFSNVSESSHYYNRSFQLYQETQGNPFAQPVQVFSNITNGFGIFGGTYTEIHRVN